ncbi:hypothetical protein LCGC14_2633870 [marine sediment metagenome]|uniref:Uncharacterized protein n=1 Tax=marine sediment metagenome TaxID=412755 RepID=A0A0F9CAF7_9ZZZZ
MVDAREGRGKEGFDKRAFDKGWDRAFSMCKNNECQWKYICYRYLATPRVNQSYADFDIVNGECEGFKDTAGKSFKQRKQDDTL